MDTVILCACNEYISAKYIRNLFRRIKLHIDTQIQTLVEGGRSMKRNIPCNLEFRVLSEEKREKIHEASLTILETTGVRMTGERTLRMFQENGAKVEDGGIVKIPRIMVEEAVRTLPREVRLYNRDRVLVNSMGPERNIYFGSIAEQLEYLDYKTNKARRFTREDMKTMCVLQDYLPHIDFTCSVGLIDGVHPSVAGQIGFIEVVRNYTKGIHVVTSDTNALKDIVKISQDLVGGKEALIETPIFLYYAEPIPPLTHPWESNERAIVCAENGIPFTYMPYCMMGGTAPIEPAAALAQCNADVLVGLVLSQLVRPGTPYVYGAMPSVFDMKSTIGCYGAPEFHLNVAASAEMAEFYGIPFYGTGTVTDSKFVDIQSISEIEMSLFSSILSRATIVHDVGLLDHCRNISPAAIFIANEIIEQLSNYVKGIEVSDDTLLLDVIDKVGPGGHFLEEPTTLKRFKKMWYPKFFRREMVNPEETDVMERVIAEVDRILTTHVPAPLAPEKEEILRRHEQELLGRNV